MEIGKIPALVVGLVVAILIITVVAIPIIDDIKGTVSTPNDNEGMRYSVAKFDDDLRIEYVSSGNFLVNGQTIAITGDEYGRAYCIMSDTMIIICSQNSGTINYPGCDAATKSFKSAGDYIEWSNGTWTLSIQGATTTGPYSWLLYPDDDGIYGFWRSYNTGIYLDHNATIYYSSNVATIADDSTTVTAPAIIGKISADGSTYKAFAYTTTAQDLTADTSVALTIKESGDLADNIRGVAVTYGGTTTYATNFIAPLEYHTLDSNQSTIRSIIDVIPILLIVSLLIAIIGSAIIGRFS